jgi:FAD/FMN-containing dehydrogenase
MHNWSPLVVAGGTSCADRMVLLDTTRHLTAIELVSRNPPVVRVQPGARMDRLLAFLGRYGYGFTAVPAPGDVTVGGALAIAGHGTAVGAVGEERIDGHTYGSVSNLVLSVTAVVWSARRGRYALRRFDRREPGCSALLTHLGRSLLTEVELRTGPDQNLRCVSYVDVPAQELFAPSGSRSSRTLAEYVREAGRVEVIWFPFTTNPWLKVWSVTPRQPAASRHVLTPYNYPFSDNISKQAALAIDHSVVRNPGSTPAFGQASLETTINGLASSHSYDLWGASRNLLHYIKPTTERVTANGYAILTRRRDVQRVVSEFVSYFVRLRDAYRSRGQYPMNMPIEIRVTGLDHPQDTGLRTAQPVALSPLAHRRDHPEWDVAVWLDILSFPGTPLANRFYREIERWALSNYTPPYACARPEWSKGWAYTDAAAWTNRRMLTSTIPAMYTVGRSPNQSWQQAVRTLRAYDPHRVLTNPFLDALI